MRANKTIVQIQNKKNQQKQKTDTKNPQQKTTQAHLGVLRKSE
jgi:hypothetical protein